MLEVKDCLRRTQSLAALDDLAGRNAGLRFWAQDDDEGCDAGENEMVCSFGKCTFFLGVVFRF